MKFSQRIGKTEIREALQIESMDKPLSNRLWNTIYWFIDKFPNTARFDESSQREELLQYIWNEFLEEMADEIPSYTGGINTTQVTEHLKELYSKYAWYEKYDLIEFLANIDRQIDGAFTDRCNKTLKLCMAGYRIINWQVVPVTDENEIQEIEDALIITNKWSSINTHLATSLKLLSDRKSPDYRNSIKESISAVEAMCVLITGKPKATLGNALKKVEEKYKIHPALQSAFSSLYGYTSDSGGIRHSLIEGDKDILQEDAKFMLVSCSAFINYLKSKI